MSDGAAPPPMVAAPDRPARPLTGFGTVYAWGLRLFLRPGRVVLLVGLAVGVGALLGVVVARSRNAPTAELWSLLDFLVLRSVLPIFALLVVARGYASELRDATMLYHLVRPVARPTVYLARFAAVVTPALGLVAIFVAVLVAVSGVSVPVGIQARIVLAAGMTVIALGALYYTLAAIFRHGVIAGLAYTFVVEYMLSILPGDIQRASLNHHARSLFHGLVDDWFSAQSPEVAAIVGGGGDGRGAFTEILATLFGRVPYDPPAAAATTLAIFAAVVLAFGCWHATRRDFALKD